MNYLLITLIRGKYEVVDRTDSVEEGIIKFAQMDVADNPEAVLFIAKVELVAGVNQKVVFDAMNEGVPDNLIRFPTYVPFDDPPDDAA